MHSGVQGDFFVRQHMCLQVYNEMFNDASPERTERMFHYLDPENTGYVDYLGWSQSMRLQVTHAS